MNSINNVTLENDIRLLEREKQKAKESLERMEQTRRDEFKQFSLTKRSHEEQLFALEQKMDVIKKGIELLEKTLTQAKIDVASYNENEIVQAQRKSRTLLDFAHLTRKQALEKKEEVDKQENAVKAREFAVDQRESKTTQTEQEQRQKDKELTKRDSELEEKYTESTEKLEKIQQSTEDYQNQRQEEEKLLEKKKSERIAIQKEIDAKFAEAEKIKKDAQLLIKQYTILIEGLDKQKKEQDAKQIQLDDRQSTLARAIKEWQEKGVQING